MDHDNINSDLYREIFDLRVRLNKKSCNWDGPRITDMLGYTNWSDMTEDHIRWLRVLDGPNGYAVYKMLEAQHGQG
jgi:hypothetical protein